MKKPLNVLVTGASSGFGAAISRRFVADGDLVFALARRKKSLEQLKTELGARLIPIVADVRDPKSPQAVFEAIQRAYAQKPETLTLPSVDLLINNAGLALGLDPAHKASLEDWKTMVDTNISGLIQMTHALLPQMVSRNRGHIINLGSIAGEFPYPAGNVYGATKAFVHQFTLNLRADLLGTAVRASCIEPGLCSGTEFSNVRFKGDDKKAQAVYSNVQALTAEDVAEAVFWVAKLPPHVNINTLSMMPVQQAFSPFAIHRGT